MKTTTITHTVTAGAIGVAFFLAIGVVSASAFGPNQDHVQTREEIRSAIETENYDLFVELTEDAPFADELSPEMFEVFVEINNARKAGDKDRVKELQSALGIEFPNRDAMARGGGGYGLTSDLVRQAIEDEDYEAFTQALEDVPLAYEIDEEEFGVLVQAHTLRQAGGREEAHELLEDAGIERPFMPHRNNRMNHTHRHKFDK
ncbi:MAG: DNA-dependent RNA polymerase auxiliary subunit epsilon [Planctomycetota bacterium]|jgi:DNA-dependent RNA polymerase auxiliary subunit epsilon